MATQHKGSEEEKLALSTLINLFRCTSALSERIHGHLYQDDLTQRQFAVLEALLHLGAMDQKSLCKKLLTSGGNMTLVVDNLETRGLVKRVVGKRDRRRKVVELTDSGKKLIKKAFSRHVKVVVKEFAVLYESEQEELRRLCRTLGLGLKEAEND
mgnify:CR=1 FL=1